MFQAGRRAQRDVWLTAQMTCRPGAAARARGAPRARCTRRWSRRASTRSSGARRRCCRAWTAWARCSACSCAWSPSCSCALAAMSLDCQCAIVSCMGAAARACAAAAPVALAAGHRHGVNAGRHLRQSLLVCVCTRTRGDGACRVARPATGRRKDVSQDQWLPQCKPADP